MASTGTHRHSAPQRLRSKSNSMEMKDGDHSSSDETNFEDEKNEQSALDVLRKADSTWMVGRFFRRKDHPDPLKLTLQLSPKTLKVWKMEYVKDTVDPDPESLGKEVSDTKEQLRCIGAIFAHQAMTANDYESFKFHGTGASGPKEAAEFMWQKFGKERGTYTLDKQWNGVKYRLTMNAKTKTMTATQDDKKVTDLEVFHNVLSVYDIQIKSKELVGHKGRFSRRRIVAQHKDSFVRESKLLNVLGSARMAYLNEAGTDFDRNADFALIRNDELESNSRLSRLEQNMAEMETIGFALVAIGVIIICLFCLNFVCNFAQNVFVLQYFKQQPLSGYSSRQNKRGERRRNVDDTEYSEV